MTCLPASSFREVFWRHRGFTYSHASGEPSLLDGFVAVIDEFQGDHLRPTLIMRSEAPSEFLVALACALQELYEIKLDCRRTHVLALYKLSSSFWARFCEFWVRTHITSSPHVDLLFPVTADGFPHVQLKALSAAFTACGCTLTPVGSALMVSNPVSYRLMPPTLSRNPISAKLASVLCSEYRQDFLTQQFFSDFGESAVTLWFAQRSDYDKGVARFAASQMLHLEQSSVHVEGGGQVLSARIIKRRHCAYNFRIWPHGSPFYANSVGCVSAGQQRYAAVIKEGPLLMALCGQAGRRIGAEGNNSVSSGAGLGRSIVAADYSLTVVDHIVRAAVVDVAGLPKVPCLKPPAADIPPLVSSLKAAQYLTKGEEASLFDDPRPSDPGPQRLYAEVMASMSCEWRGHFPGQTGSGGVLINHIDRSAHCDASGCLAGRGDWKRHCRGFFVIPAPHAAAWRLQIRAVVEEFAMDHEASLLYKSRAARDGNVAFGSAGSLSERYCMADSDYLAHLNLGTPSETSFYSIRHRHNEAVSVVVGGFYVDAHCAALVVRSLHWEQSSALIDEAPSRCLLVVGKRGSGDCSYLDHLDECIAGLLFENETECCELHHPFAACRLRSDVVLAGRGVLGW